MQRLDDLCLLLSTDMDPPVPDGQNSVLDIGGSQQEGAGSIFQGGGSEIRRNPHNLTPVFATSSSDRM